MLTTSYTEHAVDFIGRNKDKPFFVYVPHSMPHVPLFVSDKFKGKSGAGLYGDVMMEIDWSVGQINKALKANGIDENTMVIFTSDNGPWLTFGHHAGKAKPLRNGKGSTFEGGMRVPCVTWAPGRIPANSKSNDMASTIDLLPTIASIAGIEPKTKGPIDGLNINEFLHAKSPSPRTEFLYYTSQIQCIRQGDWKLRQQGKANQLFNLAEDIGEEKNLAKEHPEKVAALKARMMELDAKIVMAARPLGELK